MSRNGREVTPESEYDPAICGHRFLCLFRRDSDGELVERVVEGYNGTLTMHSQIYRESHMCAELVAFVRLDMVEELFGAGFDVTPP